MKEPQSPLDALMAQLNPGETLSVHIVIKHATHARAAQLVLQAAAALGTPTARIGDTVSTNGYVGHPATFFEVEAKAPRPPRPDISSLLPPTSRGLACP